MKSQDDRISDALWEERMNSGDIEKWDKDHELSLAMVDSLRKSSIEKTKWPYNMGSKLRDEIPSELHPELDKCIKKSQIIARDACQTEELTESYLKHNLNNN